MPHIPEEELRSNSGELLRRVEAGERFTITLAGRPVAELRPVGHRRWVDAETLRDLLALPPDSGLVDGLAGFGAVLRDPWS